MVVALLTPACTSGDIDSSTPQGLSSRRQGSERSTIDTRKLAASRDTSIRASAPNRNFGKDTHLAIDRTLVAFDNGALRSALGPEDYLLAARLELLVTDNDLREGASPSPMTLSAFRLVQDWTEAGATWKCAVDSKPSNHRPDCAGSSRWSMGDDSPKPWVSPATTTATIAARQTGWIGFDVTSDVRGFLGGALANDGWIMSTCTQGDFAELASRESRTPPALILTVRRCSPELCDDGNACTADGCDEVGSCTHDAVPDGITCNDGDACTQSDTCRVGACVGGDPVTCSAADACHVAGTCDPGTGTCSTPAADDGTACEDGNACMLGDSCRAGICHSGDPKVCPQGPDGCHPGVCEPATGACSNELACQLIAKGSVSASAKDGLDVTPLTLADGTPHNQMGAFGSAIAYTGIGNLYVVTPDRGPNDGAVPFATRYYQIELSVAGGVVTTLFRGGATLKKQPGDPFVGLATAFDATNSPESHRFDPEGVRVTPRGTLFVSDEYGPFLYEFDASGNRLRALPVPPKFLIQKPGLEDRELPPFNASGRIPNRGMEGLAIRPDGSKLYGVMQSPLMQDGALNSSNKRIGTNNRILEIDLATGATREFLYRMEDKSHGVNEIVAVNDHQFLVLERDGDGGISARFKKLFLVDIAGASDISEIASLPSTGTPAGVTPVTKWPFLDLLAPAYALAGPTFPEKIEGIAFGPDQPDGSHLLLVTHDNDFLAGEPTQIFAFSIAPSALPAWQAQNATFSEACVSPAPVTCPASDPCLRDGMCNPGTASCTPPALPAGTAIGEQTAGDCRRNQCDGGGKVVVVDDESDVPADDANPCTTETCAAGLPSHAPSAAGTVCSESGGTKCDGAGACVSCLAASDCPGSDGECIVRSCVAGVCGVQKAPAGSAVLSQSAGDCRQNQCDGAGNVVSVVDDSDVPSDGNPCTNDLCSGGVAMNTAAPAGLSCGNANVCDGLGSCTGCITANDCPGADTECAARTCTAGICGVVFRPAFEPSASQVVGDCRRVQCDDGGALLTVLDDGDVLADDNGCTSDVCIGGVPSHLNAPAGAPCSESGGNVCDGSGRCVTAFMVVRLGNGSVALSSAAAPVFLDEYTTSGALLRTIQLPTVSSGSQRRFANSGQASSEGALARSSDGHYLTLAGYDADAVVAPTASVASTPATTTNRVVARIDAAGNVDTSTSINNAFDRNNVRGAVTDDGTRFWVSGASGGVQLAPLGGVAASPISSNLTNVRAVQVVDGQLYGTSNSGTFTNVFTVGSGLPISPAPATSLPGLPAASASPFAFVFIGTSTLYIADDRSTATGGGIQKWTFDAAASRWTLLTTFTSGLGGIGVRGLTAYLSGASVILIATTADGGNPSGQHILTLTDAGSENATVVNIVNGSTSMAYRGVALPPF